MVHQRQQEREPEDVMTADEIVLHEELARRLAVR
jgi:hypothetical protein